jgi:hypothetical protein
MEMERKVSMTELRRATRFISSVDAARPPIIEPPPGRAGEAGKLADKPRGRA